MRRTYVRDTGLALALAGTLALPAAVATQPGQAPAVEIVDVTGAESFGHEDAPATLVIFADVSGSTADGLDVILHGLTEQYPTTLRVCFRHAPAADRPEHTLAHLAALAAGEQGKFWEMLDLLLANQTRHGRAQFLEMAAQLQLDLTQFSEAIDSEDGQQRIVSDQQQAVALKAVTNPTFFVNGKRLSGRKTLAELTAQIDAAVTAGR